MIPVLSFRAAAVEAGADYDAPIWSVSFDLCSGELALILLEGSLVRLPLADAAQGLVEPTHGRVLFEGQDWRHLGAETASAARARIGRLFEGYGWVHGIGIDENVGLKARHHSGQALRAIEVDAAELARVFGLPGLPRDLPSQLRESDRQRAGLVRAFLGAPDLLLLERPTRGIYPGIMRALLTKLRSARDHGAAAVWLTDNLDVWRDPAVRPTVRYRMAGAQIFQAQESEPWSDDSASAT